ncbi:MAG: oligosaccharide flippase family protein, partial [Actinomycetota bacterium]|nr:oligosaccharide flippase family protein [Actinomycetota bacterium]
MPWSLGGYALSRVITLLTTVVLARLLTPEDFGIVALAVLALTVVNVFSDVGLTGVLVVRQDFDRRAQGTVLTMLLVSGGLFSALLVALAPLAADVFREPRLVDVLRALGALSFLSGFYWFYDMLLQRELEFRARFVAQMARTGAYAAVAIALAAVGAGVWSLVLGQLAGAVVVSIVLVALAPYRVRPTFQRWAVRAALGEGHGFLLQAGATTVQDNLDFIVVGRALGADALGSYSMAYRLGEVPYASIADPIARVNFSAFARRRHAGEDVGPTFLRSLQAVALVTWPLGLLLSATAAPFTRAILGDRWTAMIGPLAVMGIWAAVRPLETTVGWLLNAVGEAGRSGRISTVLLLPLVPALVGGAHLGGTTGVAWVLLVHLTVTVLLLAGVAQRRLDVSLRRQGRAVRSLVPAAIACWVAARAMAEATSDVAPLLGLLAAVIAGSA